MKTRLITALLATLWLCTSCIYEYEDAEDAPKAPSMQTFSIRFVFSTIGSGTRATASPATATRADWPNADEFDHGLTKGEGREDFVDLSTVHFLLFTATATKEDGGTVVPDPANDRLIAALEPQNTTMMPINSENTQWEVVTELTDNGNPISINDFQQHGFRIVMVANVADTWTAPASGTTLSNLTTTLTYSYAATYMTQDVPNNTFLIPMYGVVTARSGLDYAPQMRTDIDATLQLLRAMAKIEVLGQQIDPITNNVEGVGIAIESVILNRYNNLGYVAPADYFTTIDDWNVDPNNTSNVLTRTPHIPEGAAQSTNLPFVVQNEYNGEALVSSRAYVYVPECLNTPEARITFTVEAEQFGEKLEAKEFSLAQYRNGTIYQDPNNDNAERHFNLLRNYRYTYQLNRSASLLDIVQVGVATWQVYRADEEEFYNW